MNRAAEERRAARAQHTPACAGICRLEDPGAELVTAVGERPGSRINHAGVVGLDRQRADCKRRLVVGQRLPRPTAVGALPNAAADGAGIDDQTVRRIDRDGVDQSRGGAPIWTCDAGRTERLPRATKRGELLEAPRRRSRLARWNAAVRDVRHRYERRRRLSWLTWPGYRKRPRGMASNRWSRRRGRCP